MSEKELGNRRTVITYGTFDLFHYGHRALLEHARELGDYLIVGVTSDAFDKSRGKFNVRESLIDRIHAVEATGLADKIVVEEYKGQKIEDIRKYHVDVFTVGSDWLGKFDYLREYCDVVYLPRTEGISSTALRRDTVRHLRLGCIGLGLFTERIIRETAYVSGVDITCVSGIDGLELVEADSFSETFKSARTFEELAAYADAVYINASPKERSALIEKALAHDLHVICEGPLSFRLDEAKRLQCLAESRKLVLIEALTALYLPGFQRLKLLLESGVIGEIKDIDASYSIIPDSIAYSDRYESGFYSMSSRTLLPALVFLGANPMDMQIVCGYEREFCTWSKCMLLYDTVSATLKTGRGIKTEGDMTITGTDGYIYVPAPWWRLEYFEVRGEDLRDTKKHYYECSGEGQRYLIKEFFEYCADWDMYSRTAKPLLGNIELATVSFIEKIDRGNCIRLENRSERFGGGETVEQQ